jgi:hypothetical protein
MVESRNESEPYSKVDCVQTYWTEAKNSACYALSSRKPSKLFFHTHEAFHLYARNTELAILLLNMFCALQCLT